MKARFYKPKNNKLAEYIDGYYFMSEDESQPSDQYWSFPSNFCIATVIKNAKVINTGSCISILPAADNQIASDFYYNNSFPVKIDYQKPRNEVTIYFKPTAVIRFVPDLKFESGKDVISEFSPYSDYLETMYQILSIEDRDKQIELFEKYWLSKLVPASLSVVQSILTDLENNEKVSDIAAKLGISRQYLHKMVFKHIGKSPSEYQKTHRFKSVVDEYKTQKKLTEISYNNQFFDQAHFNKHFKELTGVSPTSFFKNVDITDSNFWLFV